LLDRVVEEFVSSAVPMRMLLRKLPALPSSSKSCTADSNARIQRTTAIGRHSPHSISRILSIAMAPPRDLVGEHHLHMQRLS
jgi:hypothetical protein